MKRNTYTAVCSRCFERVAENEGITRYTGTLPKWETMHRECALEEANESRYGRSYGYGHA